MSGSEHGRALSISNLALAADTDDSEFRRIVQGRTGSVLGKGTILKVDNYQQPTKHSKKVVLSGSPNFRKLQTVNIYGVGQASMFGIRTILNCLKKPTHSVLWFNLREEPIVYLNARPFVLRESEHPLGNLSAYTGVSAASLEDMERRLKRDILHEAVRHGGNVLIHDELGGQPVPCLEAVTTESVLTPSEVFAKLKDEGYNVHYVRLPVTPERTFPPEHFDVILRGVASVADETTHVVFNCQLGIGRSTTAMAIAYLSKLNSGDRSVVAPTHVPSRQIFGSSSSSMRQGEYPPVLSLLRIVENSNIVKQEVDDVIHQCADLQDLREVIYQMKLKHERTREHEGQDYRRRFLSYLERYYMLIAFGGYLRDSAAWDAQQSFRDWLQARREIATIFDEFATAPDAGSQATGSLVAINPHRHGSVLSRDMMLKADHFPPSKVPPVSDLVPHVPDTFNFHRAENFHVYALASPSQAAIVSVLRRFGPDSEVTWINLREEPVIYINSRPYVMRNRLAPFHNLKMYSGISSERLEKMELNLRNEIMQEAAAFKLAKQSQATSPEMRAKEPHDKQRTPLSRTALSRSLDSGSPPMERAAPLSQSGGHPTAAPAQLPPVGAAPQKALVPIRPGTPDSGSGKLSTSQGIVLDSDVIGAVQVQDEVGQALVSSWEPVYEGSIKSSRELYDDLNREGFRVRYFRVPITTGSKPGTDDFDAMLDIIESSPAGSPVIFHCELGRGRSSVGMAVCYLLRMWRSARGSGRPVLQHAPVVHHAPRRFEYRSILNLLRVLPDGQFCRQQVDAAIDACGAVYNLRDKIDEFKIKYEAARTPEEALVHSKRGTACLERYFHLIVFNSYLNQRHAASPDEQPLKFSQWFARHPEITTLAEDLQLHPDHVFRGPDASNTGPSGAQVINRRSGNVLGRGTILKSDHFPGCQKMSLLPHVAGAPNFRQMPGEPAVRVYGVAIPTHEGARNVLEHLQLRPADASAAEGPPSKSVLWISLREEPVIYVNGRPYVVRDYDAAFSNLEYSGISPQRVEMMEMRLKQDVLAEAAKYNNRVLLHDEAEFKLVEVLEEVSEKTVLTPREVYDALAAEGYPVRYERLAITDEQAPQVDDFESLVQLLRNTDPDSTHVIFNCQMGRGRTTTGTVVATLFSKWRRHQLGPGTGLGRSVELGRSLELLPSVESDGGSDEEQPDEELRFHRGEYRLILRLIRVLSSGVTNKRQLDAIVDLCSAMQNLREDIAVYREKFKTAPDDKTRRLSEERGLNYLKRYFYLIVFTEYLREQPPDSDFAVTFGTWLAQHLEVKTLLQQSLELD